VTSAVISLSLGLFVLSRGWGKRDYILYFLTTITFVVYCIAHVLGVNATDPEESKTFLLLTNIILFTVCFTAHFGFSIFKKVHAQRWGLMLMYACATLLTILLCKSPDLFLLNSTSKQFFPNFLNPGPHYWIFAVFFLLSSLYMFVALGLYYHKLDKIDQNRLTYFFMAFGYAYVIGSLFFLPIFGIEISMLPTAFIGLYTIPLAYGLLKYDLLNLHVVARHALGYFIAVCFVGFMTAGVNVLNNYLVQQYTGFPFWPIPFFTGVIILFIGALIWRQMRQADVLKYEFINNISHKFRTPLTHIRWLAEELRDADTAEERNRAVDQIQFASLRLFELTSAVIDVSKDENDLYLYRFTPVKIDDILRDLFTSHSDLIERKKLHVRIDVPSPFPNIQADKTRIAFAMQIIFENSLIYTKESGEITVKARQIGGEVLITFKDNGIGIPLDDVAHIFSRFYRSTNARHTDTEGMGIGLYMAKNIIEKHRGNVWASSLGEDHGSEFTVSLPIE
jgi:signal transduction histidine kinase